MSFFCCNFALLLARNKRNDIITNR